MANDELSSNPEDLLDSLPEDEETFLKRIARLHASNHTGRALRLLESALDRTPSPEIRKTYGRICIETDAYESALVTLRPIWASGESDAETLLLVARAAAPMGEPNLSRRALERAETHGASRETVEKLQRQLRISPAESASEERTKFGIEADEIVGAIDDLLETSDPRTTEESAQPGASTARTYISEESAEESTTDESLSGNPFEGLEDTVLEEPSGDPPRHEGVESGTTAVPDGESQSQTSSPPTREGAPAQERSPPKSPPPLPGEKTPGAPDSENAVGQPTRGGEEVSEARRKDGRSEEETEESDVPELQTSPEVGEYDLDELPVEDSDPLEAESPGEHDTAPEPFSGGETSPDRAVREESPTEEFSAEKTEPERSTGREAFPGEETAPDRPTAGESRDGDFSVDETEPVGSTPREPAPDEFSAEATDPEPSNPRESPRDEFPAEQTEPRQTNLRESPRDEFPAEQTEPHRSAAPEAPEPPSTESEPDSNSSEEIEVGTSSSTVDELPEFEEESETTIEIDESLRQAVETNRSANDLPSGEGDEFESTTSPEVPGARYDSDVTESSDEFGDDPSTDPEIPARKAASQTSDAADGDDETGPEPPTEPKHPSASVHPDVPDHAIPPDPQKRDPEPDSARSNPSPAPPDRSRRQPSDRRDRSGPHQEKRASRKAASHRPAGSASTDSGGNRPRTANQRSGAAEGARPVSPEGEPSGDDGRRRPSGRRQPTGERSEPGGRSAPVEPRREAGTSAGWLNLERTGTWIAGSVGAFVILALAVSSVVTQYDAAQIESTLEALESSRSTDTYRTWIDSFDRANEHLNAGPGALRRGLYFAGRLSPGDDPATLRDQLRREQAYTAAVIEHRFEAFGSRNSGKIADRAFGEGTAPALAAASKIYRRLAQGQSARAVALARKASRTYGDVHRVENAYLAALLETGESGKITSKAESIRDNRDQLSVYERYLVARAAIHDDSASAGALLEELVEQYSPNHLGAKIARLEAWTERGEEDRATALGDKLLDNSTDSAAPYHLARLRIELGDAFRATDRIARAEEQYRSAIEEQPSRAASYGPLVDLLINNGRLDAAREQLQRAQSRARMTHGLRRKRGRLQFLESRVRSALELLEEGAESRVDAPVLRGRLLVQLGKYERARKVLNFLDSQDRRYPAGKSLELVARARMGVADAETVLEEMETLRSRRPDDPIVLRSAARVRLHFARTASRDDRRTYLDRAREVLETATEEEPQRALQYYLLCERHIRADRPTSAVEACREAEQHNDEYLPGLLTVATLHLAMGELNRADRMLARLNDEFDRRWDVAALRIRSAVRNHELDVARDLLNSWLGRSEAETDRFQLYEGLVAFARADYTKAVGHFEKARDSARHEQEASLYYAHSLARLGRLERAEEIVRELTTSPRWRAAAWLVFAEVRRRQDLEDDAFENLDLAANHYDSKFAPPWRIAHLHAERARTRKERSGWDDPAVLDTLERGEKRGDSDSPEIQLPLGIYYAEGPDPDLERAATHLEKVVDLQPHRCRAVRALVEIYRDRGDTENRKRIEEIRDANCQ